MNTVKRFYNLKLAIGLDEVLLQPINLVEIPKCIICKYTNVKEFIITGTIMDDGSSMFVEKKCRRCGSLTDEWIGDFHEMYEIVQGEIIKINQK